MSIETKKKMRKWLIIIVCFAIACIITCGGFFAYKLYKHEKNQAKDISDLNGQVYDLKGQISLLNAKLAGRKESIIWDSGEYNYLAIGNSLTRHGACSYWWHSCNGMAASDLEHDYYHIVLRHLEQKHDKVHGEAVGLSTWEVQSHDRDETFFMFDPYLNEEIDLITIQLGENAENLDTFESDYESLIIYIKNKCPKARIIIIGDFWAKANRDELKIEAASNTNVEYVSLEGIKDNKDYYAGMGTTVYDDDGNPHRIDHEGVAAHPGDNGMEAIAERVIAVIDKE